MSKIGSIALLALACTGLHPPPARGRHEMFYPITGNEVLLWTNAKQGDCILATGRRPILSRIRSSAITGRARFTVERLPAPSLEPLPPGIIVNDRTVSVRGVPVQPQCDSKDLYWIVAFQFLGAYESNEAGELGRAAPSSRQRARRRSA